MDMAVLERPGVVERPDPEPVALDHSRHLSAFDPAVFDMTRVDIVGCGSVGSRIAMEMARLGVRNLHLWDDDIVANHNVRNQDYDWRDIGRPKVEALAERIKRAVDLDVTVHKQRIEQPVVLGDVVFLAVDSMAARKNIFQKSLRLKVTTRQVIETRMGAEEFRVYGFNPCARAEIAAWSETLCDDAITVENVCQTRTTVGAMAGATACFAVIRFLQWYKWDFVRDPEVTQAPDLEWIVMLRPLTVIANGA